jgi:predicted nucleic acid-binding protein
VFANRFTAFIDACSLTSALKRNLLLSLAEAEFFRVRWSRGVMNETQSAIERILTKRGYADASSRAARACSAMERGFKDAMVTDIDQFLVACAGLPDENDAHVLAAALKTGAQVIVTENLRHFPASYLAPLNMDTRSADGFIADTIALDEGRAIPAIRQMRVRFKKPDMTAAELFIRMEASGLVETVDILKPHLGSL